MSMTEGTKNFAAVDAYRGEVHSGFRSRAEAMDFVHSRLDRTPHGEGYYWSVVEVLDTWDSDNLLPGE